MFSYSTEKISPRSLVIFVLASDGCVLPRNRGFFFVWHQLIRRYLTHTPMFRHSPDGRVRATTHLPKHTANNPRSDLRHSKLKFEK